MNPSAPSEAATVAEITRQGLQPTLFDGKALNLAVPMLIWPRSEKYENLERLLAAPIRKRAVVVVRDHMSFIDYVMRHKEDGTLIFAEITESGGSFIALIDYHGNNELGNNQPKFSEHSCKYVCEHTPEWTRWIKKSGQAMSQTEMALFVEDNMIDIIQPEAGRMLDMVKTLEATQGVEFKSAIRLDNGDRQLHFAHNTTAKAGQQGDIEIPDKFMIRVPVFQNGPAYDVECRFRYRIKDGALVLAFEVVRPHKIVELALTEASEAIKATCAPIPVLLGAANLARV